MATFGYVAISLSRSSRARSSAGSAFTASAKAQAARANLAEAGLADFVEVREGDATETLKDVGGHADFLLMDSWTDFARPVIEVMAPQFRSGAIVMADNVPRVPRSYRPYIEYVRNPANGFRSMNLPYKGGVELSVRVA